MKLIRHINYLFIIFLAFHYYCLSQELTQPKILFSTSYKELSLSLIKHSYYLKAKINANIEKYSSYLDVDTRISSLHPHDNSTCQYKNCDLIACKIELENFAIISQQKILFNYFYYFTSNKLIETIKLYSSLSNSQSNDNDYIVVYKMICCVQNLLLHMLQEIDVIISKTCETLDVNDVYHDNRNYAMNQENSYNCVTNQLVGHDIKIFEVVFSFTDCLLSVLHFEDTNYQNVLNKNIDSDFNDLIIATNWVLIYTGVECDKKLTLNWTLSEVIPLVACSEGLHELRLNTQHNMKDEFSENLCGLNPNQNSKFLDDTYNNIKFPSKRYFLITLDKISNTSNFDNTPNDEDLIITPVSWSSSNKNCDSKTKTDCGDMDSLWTNFGVYSLFINDNPNTTNPSYRSSKSLKNFNIFIIHDVVEKSDVISYPNYYLRNYMSSHIGNFAPPFKNCHENQCFDSILYETDCDNKNFNVILEWCYTHDYPDKDVTLFKGQSQQLNPILDISQQNNGFCDIFGIETSISCNEDADCDNIMINTNYMLQKKSSKDLITLFLAELEAPITPYLFDQIIINSSGVGGSSNINDIIDKINLSPKMCKKPHGICDSQKVKNCKSKSTCKNNNPCFFDPNTMSNGLCINNNTLTNILCNVDTQNVYYQCQNVDCISESNSPYNNAYFKSYLKLITSVETCSDWRVRVINKRSNKNQKNWFQIKF